MIRRAGDISLIVGSALLLLGCFLVDMPWRDFGLYARDSIVFVFLVLLVGGFAALIGRVHKAWAFMLAGILLPALIWGGIDIILATLMVILTGAAIGTFFNRDSGLSPIVRWVAGVGVLAAIAGWLLPWPVHSSVTWFSVGTLLVALRWRPVTKDIGQFVRDAKGAVAASPVAAGFWALLVSLVAAPAWLPARNIDDLAYHLNLGAELIRFGHATLDVGAQGWAMAPWSADVVHALVSVIAGKQAYGSINAWWLIVTGLLVRELALLMGADHGRAWLLSALYLSLPLTSFLAGSMQTEAMTPAILAALAVAIHVGSDRRAQQLPVVAALSGFLLGAKVASALLLIPMGIWLVVAWWRDFPWHALIRSAVLGGFVCGSSYLYAGLLTGNPVLPVLNGWFQSPWFPAENFVDLTWQTGLHWRLPWELVFNTPRYFETTSVGAAGVVTLLLSIAVIPAVWNKNTRPLALVSIASLLLVLSQIQYLRYAHPAFALFVPALGVAVLRGEGGWGWREGLIGISVCIQAILIPTSSWMLSAGALRTLALDGAAAVTDQFVPEREVVERLRNSMQETDRVLFLDPLRSYGAELPGQSVGTAWFTPLMSNIRTRMPRTAEAVAAEVRRSGANYLLIYDAVKWPEAAAYIEERQAIRVDHNGMGELYWLPPSGPVSLPTLNTDVQIQRDYPVVGQIVVSVACDKPGEAVAVAWKLPVAPKGSVGLWEWATCGTNRYAVSAIQFNAGAGAGAINLTLSPAQPERGMVLGTPVLLSDVRRDYQAQTALYRVLWAPFCRYLKCKSVSPSVTAMEHGPLLLRANEQGVDGDAHE